MADNNKYQAKRMKPLNLERRVDDRLKTVANEVEYEPKYDMARLLETPASFKIERQCCNNDVDSSKDNTIQSTVLKNEFLVKENTFNSSMKLSENPFDIFNGKLVQRKVSVETKVEITKPATTDNFLLSGLKSTAFPQKKSYKSERKTGIFNQITVTSRANLTIGTKKYYKFPFETILINDESQLYETMSKCLTVALSSAYSNFRRFGEQFKVLVGTDVFTFSGDTTCSLSSEKILKNNGIKYTVNTDNVKIDPDDVGLVCDILMNLEIPKGKPLPFVMSPFEFEGGIMFRTKIMKGPMVRSGEHIEYMYTVVGPLDSQDFLFDDSVNIGYS